ncbi:MAG: alpha-glucan family phosphorylase [Nanoarchaeota archaeon]|nr:alpha-glucan family phosphorylase [Nanoarchaeota archaeon]
MDIDFSKMHVAYFSMEIGISADIPTYSGGLGVLAGDTLRSCADLELPVIATTLLYKKGYFKQEIKDGNQIELEDKWNPEEFTELLPNTITINIEGREVKIQAWLYKNKGVTGHINPIILLDTDIEGNSDYDRTLTQQLYANDKKYRLAQEMVLGIGGVRMLESLGCDNIEKYHMNEGHSALLVLELARKLQGDDIIQKVRDKCVFTTHTPVPAGHDQFDKELALPMIKEYLHDDLEEDIFHEGKLNMTHVGLRFSEFINGVAKKHGEVSRTMFPGYHIDSITNGVHSAFWTAEPFQKLFDKHIKGWKQDSFSLRYVLQIPREEIWDSHQECKRNLIKFIKEKYNVEMQEEVLTIGFARRAATYKRGDMLFYNIDRIKKIAEGCKGLQIVFAGKAHPQDTQGKDIIRKIIWNMGEVRNKIKVCYIENYNIHIAKKLIPGVDVWLNTPERPKEASGTSGMKAAHNGVPHFSILDGWWLEGHIEDLTGWSIGEHPQETRENRTDLDSESLYDKLEYVIVPEYYQHREDWINIMKHCIAINGSFFNTHRMVQQYVLNAYFK